MSRNQVLTPRIIRAMRDRGRRTGGVERAVCGTWVVLIPLVVLIAVGDAQSEPAVTFSDQIARLLQQHCQGCHRANDVAPFPLQSYRDAHSRQDKILGVVESRKMPPWKPVPGFGDFVGPRRLSERDIDLVRA